MVQSVELLLDDGATRAVRADWRLLWEADIPSLARVTAETNRPHITLFVAQTIPPEVDEALRRAIGAPTIAIRSGGHVIFGGANLTLASSVVPSLALLNLHRQVWDTAHKVAPTTLEVPRHIAPGKWTPHITLSRRLPAHRLGEAVHLLAQSGTARNEDVTWRGAALRRWDGDTKREWTLTEPC
ncbi:2'-5' RNA ligase family protein [Rhodococcus sp. NPDC058521]|uniref:2'-5' RNA ligase family protein n=1 Tax=Rhodococcus sp. NPDC058521 TaxID=3346536 RepID=UPI00365AF2DE